MRARDLLSNSSFIIIIALLIGILTGISYRAKESTYLILGTIMTLSVMQIDVERIKTKGKKGVFLPVLLVYTVSPLMTLIPAYMFIENPEFLKGFVIMSVVPSAIGLVAFSKVLDGDVELALSGTGAVYLSSIFLTPFMAKALLGAEISMISVLNSILLLIVVPFILSRFLVKLGLERRIAGRKKEIINLLFFFLILNIVGSNRNAFFIEADIILIISAICILRTVGVGTILYFLARKLDVEESDARTYTLFGTFKNGGLAVALAVALFSPDAAIPAAISIVFDVGSIGYYGIIFRKARKRL